MRLEPHSLISVPALSLISYDSLDELLTCSKLQFPPQQKENAIVLI